MSGHSITGEWCGRYKYDAFPSHGGGFTAFFFETSGSLSGSIVDDGRAGKASLSGSFSFPSVQFTKVYSKESQAEYVDKKTERVPKGKLKFLFWEIKMEQERTTTTTFKEAFGDPVEYEGLMSEDGQTLSGTWVINGKNAVTKGSWTAQRLIEEEDQKEAEEKVSLVKQRQVDEPVS